ncbi:MAG: AAA family ATPase [Oscillospiraceae bacterium]|nr:AAA family ATPase [Oscillospiraceae bacterium]
MPVKINSLEIENVKRIQAVALEPTANGLTVIGGNNGQGKTSVLDAICWALGGERLRPSNATREGSTVPPKIKLTLSNGLIVERKGKNSDLKVTDPSGRKSGQQLLNEFVSELALNLPKFMQASSREKAETLLQIIGVGPQLHQLEQEEQQLYNQRTVLGRTRDRKKLFAEGMPYWPNAPKEPISISDLIRQQQEILARNGENQRKRQKVEVLNRNRSFADQELRQQEAQLLELQARIGQTRAKIRAIDTDLEIAEKDALELHDESTEELERQIADFERVNKQVRDNLDRDRAADEAKVLSDQYDGMTQQIEQTRQAKRDLLNGANLPLPELGVEEGELTYQGKRWDCMSGSDQLRVAVAIVRRLNPNCGFVLVDKLEQMDLDTLRAFAAWLEQEGLQAIATRVSTGDECSIIIEDGHAVTPVQPAQPVQPAPKPWKEGVF